MTAPGHEERPAGNRANSTILTTICEQGTAAGADRLVDAGRCCWRCGDPVDAARVVPACDGCMAGRADRMRSRDRRTRVKKSRSGGTPPMDAIRRRARSNTRNQLFWTDRPRHWWEDAA